MPEDHMEKLYNSKNPLVRFAHRNRLENIAKAVPVGGNLKILDAGCGEGHLIEYLHSINQTHKFYGYDVTKVAVKNARKRCPYAHIEQMDMRRMNIADNFFDVIICTEVLEHVYEYQDALQEFNRALKNGGHLILTFPNEPIWTLSRFLLGRNPIKVPDHVNSFSPKRIKPLINGNIVFQRGLPFRLPFAISLGYLLKLQK
jgi:ubiquinone/menaquinone biosynthesis C-methylase UbiE